MAAAKDYAVCFGSETGRRVLKELKSQFGDRMSYTRGDSHETAFMEGQRSVYLRILHKLRQAKLPDLEKDLDDD